MRNACRKALVSTLSLLSLTCATAQATPVETAKAKAALKAIAACKPGAACAAHLPVKVVVVTLFEIGKDEGDAAGEFQLWKQRAGLSEKIAFPQGFHDLYYNPQTQVLGMVTGMGNIKSATATLALGLDQRVDVSKAYWLVAGIAGIDPAAGAVGSAAWARYVVDGDMAHEIDAREIPAKWKYGYFPIHGSTKVEDDPMGGTAPAPANGEMFALNPSLAQWAYGLTKDIKLPDDPSVAAQRATYTGYPLAQTPPKVMMGDQLAAMTYWHGEKLTQWGRDWVKYWTHGQGTFVTSAMEETGTFQSLEYLTRIGRADRNRAMVLRAGSNFTMPAPGVTPAENMARENAGYSGMTAALEALYAAGSKVVGELVTNWPRYEKAPPK
ncbi:purine nucleoside permease [Novosphingobium umbonatum]|uniref:Purine nucleoside permease n=1 Tax=Novosphingobium umbonatum TaxID=1908524 RepID=A0A437N0V8_9SPHN|nr:purine nucleoside permease [Novosphingobium umbonatum]RVU03519.1 purine nucleoside permease [Novosphingobium umbonatum]